VARLNIDQIKNLEAVLKLTRVPGAVVINQIDADDIFETLEAQQQELDLNDAVISKLQKEKDKLIDMWDRTSNALTQEVAENESILDMLKKLEWCVIAKWGVDRRCPICMGLKSEEHDSDCELSVMLKRCET